ncbi:hypothetical protein HAX54_002243, partial [Datura stramonium]|nr:hypothetical protein [Datura stramonium]
WTLDCHGGSATAVFGHYSERLGTSHNSNFKRTPKIHLECREQKLYMFSKWKRYSDLNGIDEMTIG